MKKKKQTPTVFTFWKNNRKDQEYTLTLDELKGKYLAYLLTKEDNWITYYGHQTVWAFITSADGLASTTDTKDSPLEDLLMEVRHSLPVYAK